MKASLGSRPGWSPRGFDVGPVATFEVSIDDVGFYK